MNLIKTIHIRPDGLFKVYRDPKKENDLVLSKNELHALMQLMPPTQWMVYHVDKHGNINEGVAMKIVFTKSTPQQKAAGIGWWSEGSIFD